MTDDWRSVDERLYWIDQLLRWRPIVAAMRRLVAAIKADPRFHDLSPSMSHDALVFRRGANPEVWARWNPDEEIYEVFEVSTVDHELAVRRRGRAARIDAFLDVLSEFIDRSPVDTSTATRMATRPSGGEHGWEEVEGDYMVLAERYPSESRLVAAMRNLVAAIRADARFRDVDPRVAHGESRAGGPMNSLVFRLLARRSVWTWWDPTETTYHVALIEGDAMLQHGQSVNLADVVDLLRGYLEQASA